MAHSAASSHTPPAPGPAHSDDADPVEAAMIRLSFAYKKEKEEWERERQRFDSEPFTYQTFPRLTARCTELESLYLRATSLLQSRVDGLPPDQTQVKKVSSQMLKRALPSSSADLDDRPGKRMKPTPPLIEIDMDDDEPAVSMKKEEKKKRKEEEKAREDDEEKEEFLTPPLVPVKRSTSKEETPHSDKSRARGPKEVRVTPNAEEGRVLGAARRAIPGQECKECADFYALLERALPGQKQKMLNNCSQHRARFAAPGTPEGCWDFEFSALEGDERPKRKPAPGLFDDPYL